MGEGHSRRKGSHSRPPTCLSTQPAPGAQRGCRLVLTYWLRQLTCRHERRQPGWPRLAGVRSWWASTQALHTGLEDP